MIEHAGVKSNAGRDFGFGPYYMMNTIIYDFLESTDIL